MFRTEMCSMLILSSITVQYSIEATFKFYAAMK